MTSTAHTVQHFQQELMGDAALLDEKLYLYLGHCSLAVSSNSAALLERLRYYFGHILGAPADTDLQLSAIETPPLDIEVDFQDWPREPGKTGRKDSVYDFAGGRLVRKVRTGMVFLQSEESKIAAGPCLKNDSQVINFINSQYLNWLQQRNWLTCHASAFVIDGQALAIAGFSGGGKSTLMLQALENTRTQYLTNDRLMIKREQGEVQAAGIPKQPRINPGTIVTNPRLQALIDTERREELLALPRSELWDLEEKYDAMIPDLYGPGRICTHAPLRSFLVLNWHWNSTDPLTIKQVDLAQRRDLLAAIMKSPGPFHQYPDGRFYQALTPFDEQSYIDSLKDIPVFEACGKADFALASRLYPDMANVTS